MAWLGVVWVVVVVPSRVSALLQRRRAADRAIGRLRSWHEKATTKSPYGIPWLGHCAHSVAAAYGRSASGWNAIDGWRDTPDRFKHRGRRFRKPPRGALVFWSGGSQGYGHVGVSNGWGRFWGVDLPVSGRIGKVDIAQPERQWGLHYLGWVWPDQVVGWR